MMNTNHSRMRIWIYRSNWHLWIVIVFLAIMVFVSTDSLVFAQTAKRHPMLPHPSDEFITKLKANPKELNNYVSLADGYDPNGQISYGYFRALMLVYLATKDAKYLAKIKAMPAGSFPNCYHHQTKLSELTIAYDWFYDDLNEADRSAFLAKMKSLCKEWKHLYDIDWVLSPFNDCAYIRNGWSIFAAAPLLYADTPDDPEAKEIFDYAENILFNKYLPVWKMIMEGGGWHEGIEYVNLGIGQVIFPALSSWGSVTGRDLFQENPWIEDFIYYLIYTTRPDKTPLRVGDVAWCATIFYPDFSGLYVIYNNPYGRWYDWKYGGGSSGGGTGTPSGLSPSGWPWGEPDKPDAESRPLTELPLSHYFKGWGVAAMRSGWGEDDVHATFKCGDNYWSHSHYDSGSFTIYKRGALAIDSGTYSAGYNSAHHLQYGIQTVAHNTITVTDPADTKLFNWGGFLFPNDGGQRAVGAGKPGPLDIAEWNKDREDYETGNITKFEEASDYTYVSGDVTPAYTNSQSGTGIPKARTKRVRKFIRDFVFLRPDKFIVFDRVSAFDVKFKKRWLLHSINEPQIEGDTVIITRVDNVQNVYTWANGLKYRSTDRKNYQYGGKLFSKTLLPENFMITKVGGAGHEFEINGVNYNQTYTGGVVTVDATKGPQEPGAWRVEVEPVAAQEDDLFLHVLYACESSVNEMPETMRINVPSGNMAGALIKDAYPGIVMFSKTESLQNEVTYQTDYTGTAKHLIVDMQEGSYNIYKDGALIDTKPSSSQGTLYFEAAGGGNFQIAQTGIITGDINGDGKVNIEDLQLCVNVVLGIETEAGIVLRADVNGDGQVNVSDVQGIVNKILGN